MKKKKEFIYVLRSYIVVLAACVCVTGFFSGLIIARNNTAEMNSGEKAATVGIQREQSLSVQINEENFAIHTTALQNAKRFIEIIPAPFGNLYWLAQSVAELISAMT